MDLNKVMIIGRLTRDPELKSTPSGASVCQVGLATNYVYNNKETGQKVEQVEYHNIVLWRKLGEIAAQYLKKGQQVYIEGRLQTRSWDGTDGKKNYKTEVVAENMIMLGGKTGAMGGSAPATGGFTPPVQTPAQAKASQGYSAPLPSEDLPTIQQGEDISVDDIPF